MHGVRVLRYCWGTRFRPSPRPTLQQSVHEVIPTFVENRRVLVLARVCLMYLCVAFAFVDCHRLPSTNLRWRHGGARVRAAGSAVRVVLCAQRASVARGCRGDGWAAAYEQHMVDVWQGHISST